MNNYGKILDVCFKQWKRSLFGTFISAIPLVNFMFMGYLLGIIRHSDEETFSLPRWDNYGTLFLNGLRVIVVLVLWLCPLLLLLLLMTLIPFLGFLWGVLGLLYIIFVAYLLPSLMVMEAHHAWSGLSREPLDFCFSGEYLKHWLLIFLFVVLMSIVTQFFSLLHAFLL